MSEKIVKKYWVAIRKGEVCGVFKNRQEAVSWLKSILKHTLKDFENQDKMGHYDYHYDYSISFDGIEIKPVKIREAHLGL